jgi:hypothetical protein
MDNKGAAKPGAYRASSPLGALKGFVGQRSRQSAPEERCEMCSTQIEKEHSHVVNLESRNILCTCRPCYLLFTREGAALGKYRAIPDRYLSLRSFKLTSADWDALQIPVRMAFFFFNSALGRVVAFYPGPAGAAESLLPLDAWRAIVETNPVLNRMQPDVEALLAYGRRGEEFECFIVPIDACYALTGLVKRHWKGFDGGDDARLEIESFFSATRERSREAPPGDRV